MSAINSYQAGNQLKVAASFAQGVTAIDPTVVMFKFHAPGGAVTTYTYGTDAQLIRDGVGLYHIVLTLATSGTWAYQFLSTGTGQAAYQTEFFVQPLEF